MRGRLLFEGFLTTGNADEVCAHIEAALHLDEGSESKPRRHAFVTVNQAFVQTQPEVRMGCTFKEGAPYVGRHNDGEKPWVNIRLNDTDDRSGGYVVSISADAADQAEAHAQDEQHFMRTHLSITDGEVRCRQVSGAGYILTWVLADEAPPWKG